VTSCALRAPGQRVVRATEGTVARNALVTSGEECWGFEGFVQVLGGSSILLGHGLVVEWGV
jgi:hypothetical protein